MEIDLFGSTFKEEKTVPPGFFGGKPKEPFCFSITTYKRVRALARLENSN